MRILRGLGIVYLILVYRTMRFGIPFDQRFIWYGMAAIVVGSLIRFWGVCHRETYKESELVTGGPYRLLRNPRYLGTFVMAVGCASITAFSASAVLIVIAVVSLHLATVRSEERWLAIHPRVGPAYLDYSRRVGRWFSIPQSGLADAGPSGRLLAGTFFVRHILPTLLILAMVIFWIYWLRRLT